MIAFERIEILKDGATALYGSEAVAGVVELHHAQQLRGLRSRARRCKATINYPQQDAELSGVWGVGERRYARARRVQSPRPRAADDLRAPAVRPHRRLEPSRQSRARSSCRRCPAIPPIAPCGRRRSTATATASPTSSSRRSVCRPCPARSRPSSPIRTAPPSRHRIRRSCPESCRRCRARSARSRSASASSTSAASTRSCPRRSAAARSPRCTHAFGDTLQGRHRGARRRERGAAQQLAVVPVRGVPDGRGEPSRQSVRQRRALHRPHHRRRRRADRERRTTPTRGASPLR